MEENEAAPFGDISCAIQDQALLRLRSFAMYDDPSLLPKDFAIVEASKAER